MPGRDGRSAGARAAGEMYDLLQKRDRAMKKYEIVLAVNSSTPPAEQARKHIEEAYRRLADSSSVSRLRVS